MANARILGLTIASWSDDADAYLAFEEEGFSGTYRVPISALLWPGPGGSNKQLQWNNNGTLAGLTGTTVAPFVGIDLNLPRTNIETILLGSQVDMIPFDLEGQVGLYVRGKFPEEPGPLKVGEICTDQTSAATTPGTVVAKMPIRNAAGTIVGYLPLYDDIT